MASHRVCIIGNSHVAAWRVGMDLAPKLWEGMKFDFFAAQSDLMREMELRGKMLVPTSPVTRQRMARVSGGKAAINLHDYTHFVIVGLGFNLVKLINVLGNFQLYGFGKAGNEVLPYLSRPCYAALVKSILHNSSAMHFVRLLRGAGIASVTLVPQPYPSENIIKGGLWKRAADNGTLAHAIGLYAGFASQEAAEAGCELLFQPADTLTSDSLTLASYSADSVRLGSDMTTKHPQGEPYHMNGQFGVEMLKSYLGLLKQY